MAYTTDDLIRGIKRKGAVPTANATFQVADFLAEADIEIRDYLLPMILKARESYYSYDFPTSINPTDNVYPIPSRAVGAKLQGAYLLDSSNNVRFNLNLINEEEVYDPTVSPVGNPSFYFKGNNIVLEPFEPQSFDTVVQTIFIRPSQLCQTLAAAQITGISGTTLTFSSLPSTFTTSTELDLIKGTPHYDFWSIDLLPTAVTSTTLSFSAVPSGLAIGDWVSLSETSPVVQIPVEFQGTLEQRVANTFLRAQGFTQSLQNGEAAVKEKQDAFLLINPRAERNAKKIKNTSSLLRRGSRWF